MGTRASDLIASRDLNESRAESSQPGQKITAVFLRNPRARVAQQLSLAESVRAAKDGYTVSRALMILTINFHIEDRL